MSGLYHAEIGFPSNVKMFSGIMNLRYSRHAINASYTDRYGHVCLPDVIDVTKRVPIEIETQNGVKVKGVYRVSYNSELDLVLVLNPDGFVRTIWFNRKDDPHQTLNRSKYKNPNEIMEFA